jgi:RNA polymerase sigma-70 factor (ECF subfamily)
VQIFFECESKIVEQLSRKVKDKNKRQDLLQDIFLKFAVRFESIKHHENLCGYLYRITENAITDNFREENKTSSTDDFDTINPNTIKEETEKQYQLADCCLKSFIDLLPSKYKEALTLSELEGKPQKEAAQITGVSYSGFKSRVQRAKQMLKEEILKCCQYEFDKYGNIVGCCKRR